MNREEAAKKARESQLEMAGGDEEKLREMRREWGRKGGKKSKGGHFSDPEKARSAGKLSQQIQKMKKKHGV